MKTQSQSAVFTLGGYTPQSELNCPADKRIEVLGNWYNAFVNHQKYPPRRSCSGRAVHSDLWSFGLRFACEIPQSNIALPCSELQQWQCIYMQNFALESTNRPKESNISANSYRRYVSRWAFTLGNAQCFGSVLELVHYSLVDLSNQYLVDVTISIPETRYRFDINVLFSGLSWILLPLVKIYSRVSDEAKLVNCPMSPTLYLSSEDLY